MRRHLDRTPTFFLCSFRIHPWTRRDETERSDKSQPARRINSLTDHVELASVRLSPRAIRFIWRIDPENEPTWFQGKSPIIAIPSTFMLSDECACATGPRARRTNRRTYLQTCCWHTKVKCTTHVAVLGTLSAGRSTARASNDDAMTAAAAWRLTVATRYVMPRTRTADMTSR